MCFASVSIQSAPNSDGAKSIPKGAGGPDERLDEAVLAAYAWPADITDADLLAKLLDLNLERAGAFAATA